MTWEHPGYVGAPTDMLFNGSAALGMKSTASVDPGGPVAEEIAFLWWVMFGLGAVVFLVVLVLLGRGIFARRVEDVSPKQAGPGWLWGGGIVLPAAGISVVLALTLIAMRDVPGRAQEGALLVEVTGHQWWWEVSYPTLGITEANEIHFPVGEQVELRIISDDVIHSLWVPRLGVKLDLLPDYENTALLEADRPGVFRGACAEFCGLQHAKMRFLAIAETRDDFEAWAAGAGRDALEPADPAVIAGQEVFLRSECVDCHSIRGTSAVGQDGPDLTHIGSRRTLAGGILENTTENLREWVSTPQAVKEGAMMPDVELSEGDLTSLVAYLESLE